MSAEIMALAQGHNETAELLAKLKPVSTQTFHIFIILSLKQQQPK